MASNVTLPSFTSNFLGRTHRLSNRPIYPDRTAQRHRTVIKPPCAKFNLFEIMGGRGLCNGEAGLINELTKPVEIQSQPEAQKPENESESETAAFSEDGFDKELSGLTGGFPGGEKGLRLFIEKNPPPKKPAKTEKKADRAEMTMKKPKPPELPLLLPGMIAIVKNPNNPYHMYTGIVQRITDGKAGVLFEGGNWDHLISFRLDELERREKGPPGKNPRSAILEPFLQNDSQ